MNFQRLLSIGVLSLVALISLASPSQAEDSLALKVELRNGRKGPIRQPIVFAGERLDFSVNVSGLTRNKKNELEISLRSEVRDQGGELLFDLPEKERICPCHLGVNELCCGLNYTLSRDQTAGNLTAIFIVKDLVAEKEIKHEYRVEVRKAIGAYPVMCQFVETDWQGSFPASGRFTTGDTVSVDYWLTGITETKRITCRLDYFRTGESDPISSQEFSSEIAVNYRKDNGVPGRFPFSATQPFVGKIRLTVTDDAGNTNSVEMPLEVTGPLGLGEAAFLAEKPSKADEPAKRK